MNETPKPIQLNNFRIKGVAASNVKKGERVPVLVRAEITSDEPEFHLFMQGITNLVVGKAQDAGILVLMDRISALLLVTHEGGTADLYLQNVPFEMEIMAKRDFAKGEAVYQSGIADVRRLRMSWLKLQPKDGIASTIGSHGCCKSIQESADTLRFTSRMDPTTNLRRSSEN